MPMGGDAYPASFSITLTVLIAAQFVLGLILNLGILISTLSHRIPQVTRGNLFVRTLGWIDTLICLTLMPCTFAIIILSPKVNIVLCAFHESVVSMSISATATCVLFISLDRYGAIVTPNVQRITHKNVQLVNAFIVVAAMMGFVFPVVCLCFVTSTDVMTQMYSSGVFCRALLSNASPVYIYEVYFVSLASVSTITTMICYLKIYRIAKKRIKTRKLNATNSEGDNTREVRLVFKLQERKTAWLTLAIVSTFFLSWGPYVLFAIVQIWMHNTLSLEMSKMCLLSLGMSSTVLHPIFYTFLNKKESRHDQLKRIMIEAGKDRLRGYDNQQSIEATSTVQQLVHRTISQSISIGVSNKHDLEIFTTCQDHPKTSPSEQEDATFEANHGHITVTQNPLSGRSDKPSLVIDRTGRESSISGTSDDLHPQVSPRSPNGQEHGEFRDANSKKDNCVPGSSSRLLNTSKCQLITTPTETTYSVFATIESNRGCKSLNTNGSGGFQFQYANEAFEHS